MSSKVEVTICKVCNARYNGAEYAQCPYCLKSASTGSDKKKKSSGGNTWFWPWQKKDSESKCQEEEKISDEAPTEEVMPQKDISDHSDKQGNLYSAGNIQEDDRNMRAVYASQEYSQGENSLSNTSKERKTTGVWVSGKETVVSGFEEEKDSSLLKEDSAPSLYSNRSTHQKDSAPSLYPERDILKEEPVEEGTLGGSIQKLGKTVGRYIPIADGKGVEPAVGWLVGVKGVYYGQAFPLKDGMNKVGRSPSMDVSLVKDDSVSRDIVVKIVYDSRENEFYALLGESSSLCYINGKALYDRQKLEGFEEFEFGDTKKNKFVFVPLCGVHFQWQNYPF